MEDRDRAEVLLAQPGRELLGDDDRAVVAAGAADARSSAGSCPRRCRPGWRTRGTRPGTSRKRARDGLVEDERADLIGQPGQLAQLGHVVRVLHEPDVEDEVRLERHAVLEAEADELDRELVRADVVPPARRTAARAARAATGPRCRGRRPPRPGRRRGSCRSSAIELAMPALVAERVAVARLAEAPDQDVVAGLEEDDPRPDAATLERAAHGRQRQRRVAGADVEDDRDPGEALAVGRRRAPPGPAAARRAGCRRPCSRGPRRASRRRSCRRRTGRSR